MNHSNNNIDTNISNESTGADKARQIRRSKQSGKENISLYIIVGILTFSIIVLAITLIAWNPFSIRPEETGGPSLDTGVPFETDDEHGGGNIGTGDSGDGGGMTYNRKDKTYNFLIVGKDRAALNTDVMIIARFEEATGQVSLVQIPRDTLINTDNGYRRINTLYAHYYVNQIKDKDKTGAEKGSMEMLVSDLQSNLNIKIDNYCLLYLDGFQKIVNAVGGVYVDVPMDMYYVDEDQDLYIDIKEGYQKLDGFQAEGFVRYRYGYIQGDIGRVDAQKIFIAAFLKTVKNNFTASSISTLCSTALSSITTDMILKDAVYYAQAALSVELSSVTMMTLPGEDYQTSNGAWYYIVNREAALKVVNTYLNVYKEDITDSIFDRNEAFNVKNDAIINEKYRQTGIDLDTYTGDKADDIDIYHYSNTGKPEAPPPVTEAQTTAQTEAQTTTQTEAQTTAQTEAQTTVQTEAQTTVQATAQTTVQTTVQTTAQTSGQTSAQTTVQTSANPPLQTNGKTAAQTAA